MEGTDQAIFVMIERRKDNTKSVDLRGCFSPTMASHTFLWVLLGHWLNDWRC